MTAALVAALLAHAVPVTTNAIASNEAWIAPQSLSETSSRQLVGAPSSATSGPAPAPRRPERRPDQRSSIPFIALSLSGVLTLSAGWLGLITSRRPGDRFRGGLEAASGLSLLVAAYGLLSAGLLG